MTTTDTQEQSISEEMDTQKEEATSANMEITKEANRVTQENRQESRGEIVSPIEKRKENPRTDGDSVDTTKVENISRTRIGLMITLPQSKEPDKCLSIHLKKWFTKMKEIDDNFTVIAWRRDEKLKSPIKEANNIPNMMSKLREYFTRAKVQTEGGKAFMDVFVQHTIPLEEIKGDSEWFLEGNRMAMYKKKLQVESTTQQGWLLYSTKDMDNETLAIEIQKEIGVKVALRWKYINSINYVKDSEERKKWMALHIEVDTEDSKKASRGLNRIYGRQSEAFPLGIRMRLVAEFKEVRGNSTLIGKHTRLRLRQASFISLIEGHPSDDVQLLDYEDEGTTLRQMVMSIQSRNPQTPGNLFHAVGRDWKGRFIFNFLKNKADEARMIVEGLIPFLQHEHGEVVNLFFDPEAVIEKEK